LNTKSPDQKRVYVYTVPDLNFDDQDIKLLFQLSNIKGGFTPKMIIKFCSGHRDEAELSQALKKCADEMVKMSADALVKRSSSSTDVNKYMIAKHIKGAPFLMLEHDHDEKDCKKG
jgi:hypothetical protein